MCVSRTHNFTTTAQKERRQRRRYCIRKIRICKNELNVHLEKRQVKNEMNDEYVYCVCMHALHTYMLIRLAIAICLGYAEADTDFLHHGLSLVINKQTLKSMCSRRIAEMQTNKTFK